MDSNLGLFHVLGAMAYGSTPIGVSYVSDTHLKFNRMVTVTEKNRQVHHTEAVAHLYSSSTVNAWRQANTDDNTLLIVMNDISVLWDLTVATEDNNDDTIKLQVCNPCLKLFSTFVMLAIVTVV